MLVIQAKAQAQVLCQMGALGLANSKAAILETHTQLLPSAGDTQNLWAPHSVLPTKIPRTDPCPGAPLAWQW